MQRSCKRYDDLCNSATMTVCADTDVKHCIFCDFALIFQTSLLDATREDVSTVHTRLTPIPRSRTPLN